jgi:hypothetical protein
MWFVTDGDILIRCLFDIPCFFWGVVKFSYEISYLLALVFNAVVRKKSGAKACMREWVREKGEEWWRIFLEGTRVVGCAWSLRLPSSPASLFWSGFFRLLFWRCLCLLFWPNPYATSRFVLHIHRMRFPNWIFMLLGGCYEISIWHFMLFICIIFVWEFLMRAHAFAT